MRKSTFGILVAVLLAGGSIAAATAPDDEAIDTRRRILLTMSEQSRSLRDGEATGASVYETRTINPFGLDIDRGDAPAISLVGGTASLVVGPGENSPFSLFPDGPNPVGGDFTFGGFDDPSALGGDFGVFTVVGAADDLDAAFVEVALLFTQAGLEVAPADPNLVDDPNAGKNLRFGLSRLDGEFDVTFEQWVTDSWQEFQTPADHWFWEDDDSFTASVLVPPRFISGASSAEVHLSTVPTGSTDRASASVEILELALELMDQGLLPDALESDEVVEWTDAVVAGDLTARPGAQTAAVELDAEDTEPSDPDGEVATDDGDTEAVSEPPQTAAQPVDVAEADATDEATDSGTPEGDGGAEVRPDDVTAEVEEREPTAATDDESDDGGGINPMLPIGGGILGAFAIGGVVVARRRNRPSPLVPDDEPLPASPIDPEIERRTARNDEVLAPMSQSPDEMGAAKRRVQMQIKQNLINDSLDDGTEVEGEWVKITQRAYDNITSIYAARDEEMRSSYAEQGYAMLLVSDSGRHTPGPDEGDLWINRETYSVRSDALSTEFHTDPPAEGPPIEHNETMLGGDPEANRPGV